MTHQLGSNAWYESLEPSQREAVDMLRDVWRKTRNTVGANDMVLDLMVTKMATDTGKSEDDIRAILDHGNTDTGTETLGFRDFRRLTPKQRIAALQSSLRSVRFEMPRYKYTHLVVARTGNALHASALSIAAYFAAKQGATGRARYWRALSVVEMLSVVALDFVLRHADVNDSITEIKPVVDPLVAVGVNA